MNDGQDRPTPYDPASDAPGRSRAIENDDTWIGYGPFAATPDDTGSVPDCAICGARRGESLLRRIWTLPAGKLGTTTLPPIAGPPRCSQCARDEELLDATEAWPTICALREQRLLGELTPDAYLAEVDEAVRATVDPALLTAEVQDALRALDRDHSEGGPYFGRRPYALQHCLDGEPELPSEFHGIELSITWAALLQAFDPTERCFTGQWTESVEAIALAIRAGRLGPHGRATHWIRERRVGRPSRPSDHPSAEEA